MSAVDQEGRDPLPARVLRPLFTRALLPLAPCCMTSVINFRFKNALQQDSVTFDGSVIQVGDIKRLIAVKRGLGVEGAQELTLFDSTTSEELTDETKLVPRSSLVLVKRAPVTRFKPLTAAAPVVASAQEPKAPPPSTSESQHDDFGGGLYSSTPPVASAEEEALDSLLAGQAATWQREVRQAVIRGRGRGRGGRGGPSLDYRCPRYDAIGESPGGGVCGVLGRGLAAFALLHVPACCACSLAKPRVIPTALDAIWKEEKRLARQTIASRNSIAHEHGILWG